MSTTLCQHCQAVSLDDEELGGTTFTPEDGEPFLHFGRDVEGSEGHFSIRVGGDREDEFPDLPGLRLSVANGCSLCGLLRSAVLNEFPPQEANIEGPDTTVRIVVLKNFTYDWHSVESGEQEGSLAYLAFLSVNAVVQDRDGELSRDIYFEVSAPPGPLATWLRIPWDVRDDDALSPSRIGDIKSWISDCEQNCHHPGVTETLPTRLIDVGSEDGRDQMRLTLSSDIQTIHHGAESCKYATLSYCWGDRTSKPFFTTEKSTLQQMLQSIPMECIPCAFHDAVVVTRSLGIRYLWIDAICIVQDDSEDWAKESAIMGQIYTNSWLTLIALRGESCHDGLLNRKTALKASIPYKSLVKPDVNGSYWLRHVSNRYVKMRRVCGKFGPIVYDRMYSRWSSRGWTLQEEFLSTRRLIFGTENEYYSCGKFLRIGLGDNCLMAEEYMKPFLDILYNDSMLEAAYSLWYEIVAFYGDTNLTNSADRLPAISGLARTIHEKTAGNYLAGLWQSDLIDGLLWIRAPRDRSVTSRATFIDSIVHPEQYTAPSWSWARSKQLIRFVCIVPPYLDNVSEIEVLEASVSLAGPNAFGGVQDSHLLLRGKTFRLQGARIFGIDGMGVNGGKWMQGNVWLESISHNNFKIASCALDWETAETTKDFELCEAPWDQLMMMIVASHSIDSEDSEDEEEWEAEEDEEAKQAEEDEEAEEDKNDKVDESKKSDDDDIDKGDEDNQNEQDEADSTDGEEDEEDNSPKDPRGYFGLLLLPSSEEADSWVRVGVCMLRSDIHGRTVLDNCSEKIVKLV